MGPLINFMMLDNTGPEIPSTALNCCFVIY